MKIEELKALSHAKWQTFFRASIAAGVWFLALIGSLWFAGRSDGSGLAVAMCVISLSFALLLGLLMLVALFDIQGASRGAKAE